MFGAPADGGQTGTAAGNPDSVSVAVEDFVVQLLLRTVIGNARRSDQPHAELANIIT
jgi:hypothetical protein